MDTISKVGEQLTQVAEETPFWQTNLAWFLFGLLVGIVLMWIIHRINRKRTQSEAYRKKQEIKEGTKDIDFGNVVSSFSKAKPLYDELKTKCHPDRFTDEDLNAKANAIFQALTQHKHDYNKLMEIKQEAVKQLNIK